MGAVCLFTFFFGLSVWILGSDGAQTATVSLLMEGLIRLNEDEPFNRIEIVAGVDNAVTNGDLEVEYTIDNANGTPDVEPGFDFTPSLELPYTFKLTIEESNTESKPFILQILDDCHPDKDELVRVTPVNSFAYTTKGELYNVMDDIADYVIDENVEDTEPVTINMTSPNPTIGLVFFEGETNTKIPITGFECSSNERPVPIDVESCDIALLSFRGLDTEDYSVTSLLNIGDDEESIDIAIIDDDEVEEPETTYFGFGNGVCEGDADPIRFDPSEGLRTTIIDDDEDIFYGIVSPATIGGRESRDINVYAITTRTGANSPETTIEGNNAVCPYTVELPSSCKSTDLICRTSNDVYGTNTLFSKPKRYSRDRFGSYVISACYSPPQSIPVFVLPLTDFLSPIRGPTITVNRGEDVTIGVNPSSLIHELRWQLNGKPLKEYNGECNFQIKNANPSKHGGYYEVSRVQRGKSGWRTIIRLIIRDCPANTVSLNGISGSCDGSCPSCYNGGVCPSPVPSSDVKCVCPLGFYGTSCSTIDPGNLRIGPPGKKLTCRDLDKNIPRDCKGALFCYADPLGCQCARGYWGPKCDRVCPRGRFGPNCLQRCNCVGPWDSCDPETGVCKSGTCKSGYTGPNCQQLDSHE